jgi:solute carrier family 36 (proton-coupled amino acid transporter)
MSTPKSISSQQRPRVPQSPFQALSSYRDASPRAASVARLAQSPWATSPRRSGSATPTTSQVAPLLQQDFSKIDPSGSYGSIGRQSGLSRQQWTTQNEDPEIIKKHLVSGFGRGSRPTSPPPDNKSVANEQPLSEEFNSLQLQGGDITRQVYRYAEQSSQRSSVVQRSRSFSYPERREAERETVQDIIVPGGFRRNFLQRAQTQPVRGGETPRPTFLTRNFLHFLTLYGHFAGEDLEEWDEMLQSGKSNVCFTE